MKTKKLNVVFEESKNQDVSKQFPDISLEINMDANNHAVIDEPVLPDNIEDKPEISEAAVEGSMYRRSDK
jgi:hypothetical protein